MRLANLRGLLKPGYPHGIRSVIREALILRDLQRELESGLLPFKAIVDILRAPYYNNSESLIQEAPGLIQDAFLLAQLCSHNSEEMKRMNLHKSPDVKEMMREFVLLKESGLADILHRALEK